MRTTGRYERSTVAGEEVAAFLPDPLPPRAPPLVIEGVLREQLQGAEQALSRLELAGEMVPSLDWFIYAFVRKEAVISSQIEGTQATLVDLLTFEAEGASAASTADIEEVCNYLDALKFARNELASAQGLPLSMRLLHRTHALLMSGVRGADKHPGEVRRTQNWIGGSRPGTASFVPPPAHALPDALSALEAYMHAEDDLAPLIKAALLHVQFETIHPYLDGNGRIGRLLVMLLLEHWGLLNQPLLYLSLFFKRHRTEYYERLAAVRTHGDWEGWLSFFLQGVAVIAEEAVAAARSLFAQIASDRSQVLERADSSVTAVRLFETLPRNPIISSGFVTAHLKVSKPTAARAIEVLEQAGVLVESSGKKRDRSWAYQTYLEQLRIGTD